MELSLKQYAQSRVISYEAVRRQLKTYAEELAGHVQKRNRNTYIDETAQKILDEHRKERAVIVTASDEQTQLQINTLTKELSEAKADYAKLQNELLAARSETLAVQKEMIQLRNEMLRLQEQHLEELSSYRPALFGFYRKAKAKAAPAAPSADQEGTPAQDQV